MSASRVLNDLTDLHNELLRRRVSYQAEAQRRGLFKEEQEAEQRALKDPLHLAERAGIMLDPWQLEAFRSESSILLINCSRQAGKSTVVALIIVKYLLRNDQTIVIIAPSQRQSKELMRKVLMFWRRIGRPIGHVGVSKTSLELVNGSRLEAFPGSPDTIVGFSPDLVILEEAARVPDDTYSAASPMVAVSRGQVVAPSTPYGKRGWWYDLYSMTPEDDPTIQRIKVPATEIKRIAPEFLQRELHRLGPRTYREWYMCSFEELIDSAFDYASVEAAFDDNVPPLFPSASYPDPFSDDVPGLFR